MGTDLSLKPGGSVGRVRILSDEARQAPLVNGSQILAAGFASAGAALITSKFGVAGTLLGAALTTMIITGGSAILRAYIGSTADRVRSGATRLRERRQGRATVAQAPPQEDVTTDQANPPG